MKIVVRDKMQKNYRYELIAPEGKQFAADFSPELTPPQMLRLGIFGGKYITDCGAEFPAQWFARAKLSPQKFNVKLNFFGVRAGQPLAEWRRKGWICEEHDPRGWFQWYCRYYRGRRLPDEDSRQIKRWRAFRRHIQQIKKHCARGDLNCRRGQRQALLQWGYDARKM